MTFKIEKGMKIPNKRGGVTAKYPWAAMQIGDSFVSPIPAKAMGGVAQAWARNHGTKYAIRHLTPKSCRVWRIQ